MHKFFAYISRMKYITRWSLMRSSVSENIQEHSHMVAVLAHALGVIRRDVFHNACDPAACAEAALFHDAWAGACAPLPYTGVKGLCGGFVEKGKPPNFRSYGYLI